ncbi:hypothetical protein NECAME_07460 [Necator americanus]|uniref:Peptidase aspartic putative domain-containing protein n=1 Tax=Necator americanus TaxID=51031 RepID=W2TQI9_NECAM|nr:hypothetical protein NECAME_07460 [Necator americanus]ETN83272.1 hypothetical protein NECAME_07460 [Necator americanus]
MSTSLSTRQGLLTRTTGRLTTVLADVANEVRIQLPAAEELRKTYVQDKKLRLMKLKKRIHATSDNVDNALRAYTEAADALDSNTPQLPAVLVDIAMEQISMTVGADRSFISQDLSKRLQLKNVDTFRMNINTFGEQRPKENECGVTSLQIFDGPEQAHQRRQRVPRRERHSAVCQPQARRGASTSLLGCSDAFSLIDDKDREMKTLPSGLRLIPSLLGYLVNGGIHEHNQESAVTALSSTTTNEDAKWAEFLALQSSGIQKFAGTKAQEQEQVNKMVRDSFESTIEHHNDGYHVQLPWKEDAHLLPDNKPIAFKCLCSNLAKLRTTPDILQQYQKAFLDQIDKGIIEKVDAQQPANGNIVNYLSLQAMITPMKEFTKLRVVFDASAHFKIKPKRH